MYIEIKELVNIPMYLNNSFERNAFSLFYLNVSRDNTRVTARAKTKQQQTMWWSGRTPCSDVSIFATTSNVTERLNISFNSFLTRKNKLLNKCYNIIV